MLEPHASLDQLATLAHEFRNPLSAILSAAQVLRGSSIKSACIEATAKIIERQSLHLMRMVDGLFNAAAIEKGKIELQRVAVDVRAIAYQAIEACRPAIAAASHQLTVELPLFPLVVFADPVRVLQIISNLLDNAVKFSEPCGTIGLSVQPCDRHVQVKIQDDGIGIRPEALPEIFGLFVQAGSTLCGRKSGLGIGLSVAKQLAELHGGWIEAESAGVGAGSTFTLYLPE